MSTFRRLGLLGSASVAALAGALALCGPASAGSSATPQPCRAFTPCTPAIGGWASVPVNGAGVYTVSCPGNLQATGADAVFPGAVQPLGILVGGFSSPGVDNAYLFGPLGDVAFGFSFKPGVGCSPIGARVKVAGLRAGSARARVRTLRLRPDRAVRLGQSCARGERLVHHGSSVVFFTRRAPAAAVVRSGVHRNRRVGAGVVAEARPPRGLGDDERVELQVTALCRR
jgi:hypothetical protein